MTNLTKAAQEIVDWCWFSSSVRIANSVVATIPWDLLWKLRDALEKEQEQEDE
jgi:hypothetical protein